MVTINAELVSTFLTIFSAVFVAELTDKDALLLLAMATRTRPRTVFAAGSIAFVITTAIIVPAGSLLIIYVPIFWIKMVGGGIMLAYAVWELKRVMGVAKVVKTDEGLLKRTGGLGRRAFFSAVGALVALDLAGDATELLIIVFVAQFRDPLLVFVPAALALIAATALETILGNRIGRVLSVKRIRYLSIAIFVSLGVLIIIAALFFSS